MNISEIWKLYNESEKRVPEFDTALANLARTLGVTPYDAFKGFAKIMGAEDGISTAASAVSFPLSKRANTTIEATTAAALELLFKIENASQYISPDTRFDAAQEIGNILDKGDEVAKKGLYAAMKQHMATQPKKSMLWNNIPDAHIKTKLFQFSQMSEDLLFKEGYVKEAWRFSSRATADKLLRAAEAGDPAAISDFKKIYNTQDGKILLAHLDDATLAEKLPKILEKAEIGSADKVFKDIIKDNGRFRQLAADLATKRADQKSFANILSRMFGSSMPVTTRLEAAWHGAVEMASLAKSWPKLAAILGLAAAGVAAFGFFKMKGSGGGKDTPSGSSGSTEASASGAGSGTGATSGTTPDAASGVSPDIIAGGDIADRVRARLKQVYSGGKK
jgi:hypothetical protein